MRILLVEDEKHLSDNIKKGLSEAGFAVDAAFDGEEGLYLATTETYDCIILDIMLPKMDGVKICETMRLKGYKTPILMLTAKGSVEEVAQGLDSGADDYLTKPFAFIELKSRIQALLRRGQTEASPVLRVADLELDPGKHTVSRAGKGISLTPKEFSILEYLMRHRGEVVTRTMIIEHVWDINYENMSNVVDAFMATLRKKVDKNRSVKLIHTLHGVGFKISTKP
ncbi:MAG: Response regulator receiver domain protein (CheY-like) [Candidatus Amesbacteria bacterium GW2011_GWB1_47_19]|nr:MAG: Response regulator receiver domain protein (CheY-like) [Candidatus Amesbacteria bacterium GW2011_GWA1_44_24]KKU30986.1 MAG: Response regulator receiver domain protein (CheY-like) [Candidatus Amesbacteria bacterium GW2011_GWC1_46_24]KKU67144.1 MAG: Response regulator receiver domain protein (CheY-like) [Candidatus Amesbacteria bacterium GW2011_GWB1_47_19]OGD05498.1 MAG: DNA-binding response regulator [Candidatus Amesbacteria bacterium RIFOXYB1_FULL_47_13]HBC73014.1 DNA-binding response r